LWFEQGRRAHLAGAAVVRASPCRYCRLDLSSPTHVMNERGLVAHASRRGCRVHCMQLWALSPSAVALLTRMGPDEGAGTRRIRCPHPIPFRIRKLSSKRDGSLRCNPGAAAQRGGMKKSENRLGSTLRTRLPNRLSPSANTLLEWCTTKRSAHLSRLAIRLEVACGVTDELKWHGHHTSAIVL